MLLLSSHEMLNDSYRIIRKKKKIFPNLIE